MSPAPRRASDDEVFAAVQRAMARVGPRELTLGVIAGEVGLTPSALVQRFGSKAALLRQVAESAATTPAAMLAELRRPGRSALDTVRAYAGCMGALATTPAALARNLAYLQTDLSDPGLRGPLRRQGLATRRELARLLEEAVAAGDLREGTPVETLARLVEAVVTGALFTWAVYQERPAGRWIGQHVDDLLSAYLAPPRRARR